MEREERKNKEHSNGENRGRENIGRENIGRENIGREQRSKIEKSGISNRNRLSGKKENDQKKRLYRDNNLQHSRSNHTGESYKSNNSTPYIGSQTKPENKDGDLQHAKLSSNKNNKTLNHKDESKTKSSNESKPAENTLIKSSLILESNVQQITNDLNPILLDSPSSSIYHVTFDTVPKIKLIGSIPEELKTKKRSMKFEVRDRTIILCKSMLKVAKKRAKKYSVIIPSENTVTLKYRLREDLETDLRALGLKPKTYVENRLIVHNFSYKETDQSVLKFFSQFAPAEKVVLEKNTKGFCTGKGTVTFATSYNPISDSKLYDLRLNGRLLRVERIKKQIVNTSRLFISHMNKNLKIADLRLILKENNHIPKSIKIDLFDGRNKGFGFVEFSSPQEANAFIEDYEVLKPKIGKESFVEFSQEKKDFKPKF
jgi:hypothetical protein